MSSLIADQPEDAIRHFLSALDRGLLPVRSSDFLIGPEGDRAETAYLTALRACVATKAVYRQPDTLPANAGEGEV